MKSVVVAVAWIAAGALVAGCGDSGTKPTPKVAVAQAAAEAKVDALVESKAPVSDGKAAEAPDTHGMPGMADPFKGDERAEKK